MPVVGRCCRAVEDLVHFGRAHVVGALLFVQFPGGLMSDTSYTSHQSPRTPLDPWALTDGLGSSWPSPEFKYLCMSY